MSSALVKWQLKKIGKRLHSLRAEVQVIDEQRMYLVDDADDLDVRAVVSESGRDRAEARSAEGHVAAMGRAKAHAQAEIARLEARQDELLDKLSAR